MKKIQVKGPIIPSNYQPVYDYFGMEATSPKKVAKLIDEAFGDELEVEINSGGGDVFSGSEIYTALKAYRGNVIVNIVGIAASAASVIAMAGKKVRMTPTGQFMIHNVSSFEEGDHRAMTHAAEVLKNANQSIANAYMLKTGMDSKKLLSMMDQETWLNAQTAKEAGFIDEVMFDEDQQLIASAAPPDSMLPKSVIDKVLNELNDTASKERCFLMQKNSLLRLKGVIND